MAKFKIRPISGYEIVRIEKGKTDVVALADSKKQAEKYLRQAQEDEIRVKKQKTKLR